MGKTLNMTLCGTEADAATVDRLVEHYGAETRADAILQALAEVLPLKQSLEGSNKDANQLRNALLNVINTTMRCGMAEMDAQVALTKAAKLVGLAPGAALPPESESD